MAGPHRKVPYSGRKKKAQLQEHRAKIQRRDAQDDPDTPLEERLQQVSTGKGLHSRYQIPFMRFLSETQEEVLAAKERGSQPLVAQTAHCLPDGQISGFWDASQMVRLMRRPQWQRGETAETINTREAVQFSQWLHGLSNVTDEEVRDRRARAFVQHEHVIAQRVEEARRRDQKKRRSRPRADDFDFDAAARSDSDAGEDAPPLAPAEPLAVTPDEMAAALARMPPMDHRVVSVLNYNQFEVNMRVWQELWRVLELADVACVLLDARFPAAHLPACLVDLLDDYEKPWIVMLHKADLVPEEHLVGWTQALRRVFPTCKGVLRTAATWDADRMRSELLAAVCELHPPREDSSGRLGRHSVCLLGQPSVGKSSLLNALMGRKLTRTSRTPGCSKHLQTGFMPVPVATWSEAQETSRELLLIDCPGVIFPVRGVDRALFVVTGVIPLGRTREFFSAVRLLMETQPEALDELRIAPSVWERAIGEAQPTLEQLTPLAVLSALAEKRKFCVSRGRYDIHRAGIGLLMSVVDGQFVYSFQPPTDVEIAQFAAAYQAYRESHRDDTRPARSPDDELDVAGDTSSGDSEVLEEEF